MKLKLLLMILLVASTGCAARVVGPERDVTVGTPGFVVPPPPTNPLVQPH